MALALVRCSIEADQGGTLYARDRVSLVSWEDGIHAVLFMVLLGPPGTRPVAQALWLPFEYMATFPQLPYPHPQLANHQTHLPTELEVGHHYGNLRACDEEDNKDEEEETEQVVKLVLPNGTQDEKQLHKHSTKRKDTGNERAEERRREGGREREREGEGGWERERRREGGREEGREGR